jgi:excisionase family DNA binding protein
LTRLINLDGHRATLHAPRMPTYLDATEAARRLHVSRPTLYAYVSRGLLAAYPSPDGRGSRYREADVARLADQRAGGRRPRQVVRHALDWAAVPTAKEEGRIGSRPVNSTASSAPADIPASRHRADRTSFACTGCLREHDASLCAIAESGPTPSRAFFYPRLSRPGAC